MRNSFHCPRLQQTISRCIIIRHCAYGMSSKESSSKGKIMPALTEYIKTLQSKIKPVFFEHLPDDEQWSELTTSLLPDEEAEVTRLCKLLTAQEVIGLAIFSDANLRYGSDKDRYKFISPIKDGMKIFSAVTTFEGFDEDAIYQSMKASMPSLCSSYFKKNPVAPRDLKQDIKKLSEMINPGFLKLLPNEEQWSQLKTSCIPKEKEEINPKEKEEISPKEKEEISSKEKEEIYRKEKEEINRLCKLVTVQNLIKSAKYPKLRNEIINGDIFNGAFDDAKKEILPVSMAVGNDDYFNYTSMKDSIRKLVDSYFKNHARLSAKAEAEKVAIEELTKKPPHIKTPEEVAAEKARNADLEYLMKADKELRSNLAEEERAKAEIGKLSQLAAKLKPGEGIEAEIRELIKSILAVPIKEDRDAIYKALTGNDNTLGTVFKIAVDDNNIELLKQILLEHDVEDLSALRISLPPGGSISDDMLAAIDESILLPALSVFGNNPTAYGKCLEVLRRIDSEKVVRAIGPNEEDLSPETACEAFSNNRLVVLEAYKIKPLSIGKADINLVKTLVQEGIVSLKDAHETFRDDVGFAKEQKAAEEAERLRASAEEAERLRFAAEEAERQTKLKAAAEAVRLRVSAEEAEYKAQLKPAASEVVAPQAKQIAAAESPQKDRQETGQPQPADTAKPAARPIEPAKVKKELSGTHYDYQTDSNAKGRYHALEANLDKCKELKGQYVGQKGDHLKSSILLYFKTEIEKCTKENLKARVDELKESPQYKVIAKGQGYTTKLFGLETSSVKAFNKMVEEKKKDLGPADKPNIP